MNKQTVARRDFMKLAGGATVAAGAVGSMITWAGPTLVPQLAEAEDLDDFDLFWAGTDGWMHLPASPAIPPFHPDPWGGDFTGDDDLNCYIFGFRNVTELSDVQRNNQKMKAQHNAPLFWAKQYDPAGGPTRQDKNELRIKLTNLGLAVRPDLFDAHTIHWHGFRNVIPFFDGEPTGSLAVPAGRQFIYVYRAHEPGTYMYHCHVEDVEHVHMGMTGLVFVRPLKGDDYIYNDTDDSTRFDREYAMFMSEVWAESHWSDAHIQLPEWSDYRADFALLNGRVYPDTLAPNAPINVGKSTHTLWYQRDDDGDLVAPVGHSKLKYQPHSSLVTCNEGEKVALRFANLGFREGAMTIAGMTMHVVGRDATHLTGIDGTDASYMTEVINVSPGESYDVILTAPAFSGGSGSSGLGYDVYMLYNRNYVRSNNLAAGGFGGQATEIRVYPPDEIGPQMYPNDHVVGV